MRRLLLVVAVGCLMSGCSFNKQFVKSVDDYTKLILPEYKGYIQKDTSLDTNSKRIRTQTADQFQLLINDTKTSAGMK
jgi:hypothetical protein